MSDNRELRFAVGKIEVRSDGEGESTLVGISPPWDTFSSDGALPGFREIFERGAFENLDDDILATVEHDNGKVIGRTSAGTLDLADTGEGLEYRVSLPNTTAGRDLVESVKRGDIKGSSFEFTVKEGGERWVDEGGTVTRTIKRNGAVLRQVGPVARPAYGDAPEVALRSMEAWRSEAETKAAALKRKAAARRRALKLAEAAAKV